MKIYVSKSGSDNNPGTYEFPVASLQKATELVKDEVNEILIGGGIYEITSPVTIKPGIPKTTVKPAGDEKVKIRGGKKLSGFEKSTVNGVDCWVCNIFDCNLKLNSLFVNGKRRYRPRLPKQGFYYIKDLPDKNKDLQLFEGNNRFYTEKGHINPDWKAINDIMTVVMHYWIEEHLPIDSFDSNTGLVTSSRMSIFALLDDWSGKFAKYYLENVFEALTDPGEYYFDRENSLLYYIPCEGENIETAEIITPATAQLLVIEGEPDNKISITFENIDFEYAEIEQPIGGGEKFGKPGVDFGAAPQAAFNVSGVVFLKYAQSCVFNCCNFSHLGLYGMDISEGCNDIKVSHCEFFDIGAGGIKIDGAPFGGENKKVTHHIEISDNHIHHAGRFFHSACGVLLVNAHHNIITHNEIHDLFYTGISCGWVWGYSDNQTRENTIEYNHIYDLGQGVLSDMGGIYTLGIQPGTVIRNNLIHDIKKANYGGWAIYPDEGSAHIIIENNVCYNTTSQGFHQHYGRENIVRNNIFAFGGEGQIAYTRVEPHFGFTFEKNIVISDGQPMYVFKPEHKVKMDLNLYYDIAGKNDFFKQGGGIEKAKECGLELHSVIADPKMKNISGRDFTLLPGSPAYELGFVDIDLSTVGIRPITEET